MQRDMNQRARPDAQIPARGPVQRTGENGIALSNVRDVKLLLTPQETADALGINRSTLYLLIMRQDIPSLKIGRRRYIPVKSLETWINDQLSA